MRALYTECCERTFSEDDLYDNITDSQSSYATDDNQEEEC